MQPISFAVVASAASRQLEVLTRQLGQKDEILVCHTEEVRDAEIHLPDALRKAINPWVVVLQSYETIETAQLDDLRRALAEAETSHYLVSVELPRAAGQTVWRRPERRIFCRDYQGHRLSIAKQFHIDAQPMLKADATVVLNHRLCSSLEWVEREPESAVAWVGLAGLYSMQRNWVKAESAARHAMLRAVGPEALDASQLNSLAMLRQGKHRQVLEHARTERQLGIRSMLSIYWQAHAHQETGNFTQALTVMDECCQRSWDPGLTGNPAIATLHRWLDRADLLVQLHQHDDARDQIATLGDLGIGAKRGAMIEARACCGLGLYAEALSVLTPWLRESDTEGAIARMAADLFAAIGQHHSAADYYATAWQQGAGDEELYTRWLHVAELIGDTARVEAAYAACAHATEVNTDLLLSWARNFENAGEFEKANSCYREALARNPDNPDLYFELAHLLSKTGSPIDAVHLFAAGLRLDPHNVRAALAHQEALEAAGLKIDGDEEMARAA